MSRKSTIKSGAEIASPTIIGTYQGECADANITNKNGLDITRPVWENVFSSQEYQDAIKNGWYIGFLGHPEDPNCMDFEHACIVMTEGHIEDSGKVYGAFNLVDTPVGRIVKAFQDAGVQFGISVRGAGDIVDNSVDPDTFVFRGFDLVSFPAYPESIPTFTEIAASTDLKKRKQYKVLCSTVMDNMNSLSKESADIVQSCFAEQSPEYQALEEYKTTLIPADNGLSDERVQGLVNLYTQEHEKRMELEDALVQTEADAQHEMEVLTASYNRKFKRLERIVTSQLTDMDEVVGQVQHKNLALSRKIEASEQTLKEIKDQNLKYKHKIAASTKVASSQESILADLKASNSETVRKLEAAKTAQSNLDRKVRSLENEITACKKLIAEYQDAYANLYATAIGVNLEALPVTASTSVQELRTAISGSVSAPQSTDINSVELVNLDDPDDGLVVV